MRKRFLLILCSLITSVVYGQDLTSTAAIGSTSTAEAEAIANSLEYERQADVLYSKLDKERDVAVALQIASDALDLYKKAVDLNKNNDMLIHKYVKIIEMEYNFLIPDDERKEERQKVYADALAFVNRLYPDEKESICADYAKDILFILNIDFYGFFQGMDAVNKIKYYTEKIYNQDKAFENYDDVAVLGRINFLAPNIPFLLTWPDKNISKKYIEEALKYNPDSLLVKFFLADTLYALDEKDTAVKYYKDVMASTPRDDINYFRDKKIQRICGKRMEVLGIK